MHWCDRKTEGVKAQEQVLLTWCDRKTDKVNLLLTKEYK
jgi:hypothetical protein